MVWDHERNITDEQARACADTGGVVGITGVGIFLGPNDASIDALIRHIDYVVDLLGPRHAGLATDFPIDEDSNAFLIDSPDLFSDSYTRWGPTSFP
jgi:membrane dipeptidase